MMGQEWFSLLPVLIAKTLFLIAKTLFLITKTLFLIAKTLFLITKTHVLPSNYHLANTKTPFNLKRHFKLCIIPSCMLFVYVHLYSM